MGTSDMLVIEIPVPITDQEKQEKSPPAPPIRGVWALSCKSFRVFRSSTIKGSVSKLKHDLMNNNFIRQQNQLRLTQLKYGSGAWALLREAGESSEWRRN